MLAGGLSTSGQSREVSIATLWAGNHPCKQLPTCSIRLNQISGKILTWPPILIKKVWNIWRGGRGVDLNRCTSANNVDLRRSAWICKDSLKQMLNDLLWSTRIHKDWQQEQQLMCRGLYKPRLVIHNNQQNQVICKHASKEPRQQREVPNHCDHPESSHMRFGVIHWPHKTQSVTALARC